MHRKIMHKYSPRWIFPCMKWLFFFHFEILFCNFTIFRRNSQPLGAIIHNFLTNFSHNYKFGGIIRGVFVDVTNAALYIIGVPRRGGRKGERSRVTDLRNIRGGRTRRLACGASPLSPVPVLCGQRWLSCIFRRLFFHRTVAVRRIFFRKMHLFGHIFPPAGRNACKVGREGV